uniref:Uncharacterized protein n=1 Tax=Anopheles culicifacies TaxID=139723 RepID=A0A182MBI6_9DIPT
MGKNATLKQTLERTRQSKEILKQRLKTMIGWVPLGVEASTTLLAAPVLASAAGDSFVSPAVVVAGRVLDVLFVAVLGVVVEVTAGLRSGGARIVGGGPPGPVTTDGGGGPPGTACGTTPTAAYAAGPGYCPGLTPGGAGAVGGGPSAGTKFIGGGGAPPGTPVGGCGTVETLAGCGAGK